MHDELEKAAGRFTRRHWILLACLLAGVLATRLWALGVPGELYFDEVYFGFTAERYVAGDSEAYNPWAQSPPGKSYEWTHPPLGKLIIAGTMALTSTDMWGMRLSSVLFGTAGVALVVLLGFLLTRSPPGALVGGLLYACDGLNFVQSRIATIDIHETAFILAAVAFYVAWRRREGTSGWLLLGAGAMAGATLATKWVGVFLIALLGADLLVLWIIRRRRNGWRTIVLAGVCLGVVPAAIYLASYIHYFLLGNGWADFIELQKQMWYYHTRLKAQHPSQSVPLQWVLNLRPVWMYVSRSDDHIANIYNLGNSVVLYFGLVAMALTAVRFVRKRLWEAGFLAAAYLIFWLPWVASPRVMFFYHYLPSTAFLCVAAGWVLGEWQALGAAAPGGGAAGRRALRVLAWVVPALALAWFAVFYPDWTAIPVPVWWDNAVYGLIPSWK